MKPRLFLIAALLSTLALGTKVLAQNNCDESVAISQAEKRYATGNFDEVFGALLPCLETGFSDNAKVEAYKILSLTYLAIDSLDQSMRMMGKLLTLNPRFEPEFSVSPRYKALFQVVRESQEQVVQVTSVSKKAENLLYVPATIVVLTSKDFVQRGYQNLEQVLYDLPGFDVIRGNGPGFSSFYQRGYRSTSNDRMLMLIDGVEENDLASSNVALSRQYALSDVERVEVIYGPASTLYGANAFVGVINIITKNFRALPGPGRQVAFSGQARTGGLNTHYLDGVLTAKTPDLALSITTRVFRSDELDLSSYPEWDFGPRTAANYESQFALTGTDASGRYRAQQYIDRNRLTTLYPNSDLFTVTYAPNGTASALQLTPKGAQRAATLDNALFGKTLNDRPVRFNDTSLDWLVRGKLEFKDITVSFLNWKTDEGATPWYTNRSAISADKNPRWITHDRAFSITYNRSFSDKFQLLNIASYLFHEIDGNTSLVSYNGYYNGRLSFLELARDSVARAITTYQYRVSTQLRNELRLFWTPSARLDVSSGIEVRSGLIQGNYITSNRAPADETGAVATGSGAVAGGNNFKTTDLGLYSQATYRPLEALRLVAGVRVDYNRIRTGGGYGTVANPRLAAIYGLKRYILKLMYATAFKDASFLQKYATTATRTLPNPTLQPERVRNLEVSLTAQFSKRVSANLVAYSANYSNAVGVAQVVLETGQTTQQFQGIGRRQTWGIQGEGSYKSDRFNAWWNLTYTNPTDPDTGLRISDIADYMANAGVDYRIGSKLSLYASGNYVGPRRTGAGTSGSLNPTRRFDPYFLLNANLTYPDLVNGLTLQASVSNLLGTRYAVPGIREADNTTYASRFPQPGRLFSFGVYFNVRPRP